jgi:hypothetical protein
VDTVGISVVVPAYNEVEASQIQVVYPTSYLACFKKALRLPVMMDATIKYLEDWATKHTSTYEVSLSAI